MIRVTTLESFRRFRDNVTETYDTEEKLIEHIKGEFKGNCKTEIGSAFHYLIERPLTTIREACLSIRRFSSLNAS